MSDGDLTKDPQRYELLIGSITDYAIFLLDSKGARCDLNPDAQRFKGYTEGEILGRHFSESYIEEDQAVGLPERALSLAKSDGRFESEGWRVRKGGERFWAHVVIDPVRNGHGSDSPRSPAT